MALIEQTLFNTIDKVQIAIDRLRAFEPKDRPYWLAFSGGKDSCVILELANMAGVNFEALFSLSFHLSVKLAIRILIYHLLPTYYMEQPCVELFNEKSHRSTVALVSFYNMVDEIKN